MIGTLDEKTTSEKKLGLKVPLLFDVAPGNKIKFASAIPMGGGDSHIVLDDKDVMFRIDPINEAIVKAYESVLADISPIVVPKSNLN